MKIVLAIDSFKECLDSSEVCLAAAEGIQAIFPSAEIISIPLSDGGEGLNQVIEENLETQIVETEVHDPLMNPICAKYAISNGGKTAFIEMVSTAGLSLLSKEKRNPCKTSTYGFGEQILDAIQRNCREIIIGIGGSCTNDGGTGMMQALGFRFYNEKEVISRPMCAEKLQEIKRIERVNLPSDLRIRVACDVQNPLYGPQGATYVYAPQKGANEKDLPLLDEGLRKLGNLEKEYTAQPGDGAAGGAGYALREYLGAKLESGIQIVLDLVHFDEKIQGADLIITGEGRADLQTLMGKVPHGVLERGKKCNIPTVLIAGDIRNEDELKKAGFAYVLNINKGTKLRPEECMKPHVAKKHINQSVASFMSKTFGR